MNNVAQVNTSDESLISNNIYLNKEYVLMYEYGKSIGQSASMTFSGWEIEDALLSLPEYQQHMCNEHLQNSLSQLIAIWGRLKTNNSLSNIYQDQAINFVTCAMNGCEDCQEIMRQDFAAYMAINLDRILGGDVCALFMCDAHSDKQ